MCVWHDSSSWNMDVCVTWLCVCDMTHHLDTHSLAWCPANVVPCDMSQSRARHGAFYLWRDSFICVCDMTHSHVRRDAMMCVTWLDILMCVWNVDVSVWHIGVCVTYWCVFDILMCVWHIDVCATYWCVFDILMCVWHVGVCVTYWCVCDILMCAWHIDVCLTCWCVCDILMCVKHIDVCATYWCVCDMSRHRQTPSRTSCAARAVSALRHSCVLHHTIQIHVYVFEALWRSHSA